MLSNGSIDVSEDTVVVNVIAAYADQDLTLNAYPAVYQNQNVSGDYTPYAGRIVYNLAAEENGAYVPYTGTAAVDGSGTGTYLAARGTLDVTGGLTGAAYGDTVRAGNLEMAVVGAEETKEETEAETETETEAETESETEEAGRNADRGRTEAETETETETEEVTEAETETGTETEGLTESELETEAESETETEAVTEAEPETEGETETETETEGLIEETEVETEADILLQTLETETEQEIDKMAEEVSFKPVYVKKVNEEGADLSGTRLSLIATENIIPKTDVTINNGRKTGKRLHLKPGILLMKKGRLFTLGIQLLSSQKPTFHPI